MNKNNKNSKTGCNDLADKKYPCPDCNFCQWCPESKCRICRRSQQLKINLDKKNNK